MSSGLKSWSFHLSHYIYDATAAFSLFVFHDFTLRCPQSYGILLGPFDFFHLYNPFKYHMIGTIYRPHVLRCYICNVSNNVLQLTEVGVQIIGKEGIDLNQKLKWL